MSKKRKTCPNCGGSQLVKGMSGQPLNCPQCGGRGWYTVDEDHPSGCAVAFLCIAAGLGASLGIVGSLWV